MKIIFPKSKHQIAAMTEVSLLRNIIKKLLIIRAIFATIDSVSQKSPRDKWIFFLNIGSVILKSTGANKHVQMKNKIK